MSMIGSVPVESLWFFGGVITSYILFIIIGRAGTKRLAASNSAMQSRLNKLQVAKDTAVSDLDDMSAELNTVSLENETLQNQLDSMTAARDTDNAESEKISESRAKVLKGQLDKITDLNKINDDQIDEINQLKAKGGNSEANDRVMKAAGQKMRFWPYLKKIPDKAKASVNKQIEQYNADVAKHLKNTEVGKWKGQETPVSKITLLK